MLWKHRGIQKIPFKDSAVSRTVLHLEIPSIFKEVKRGKEGWGGVGCNAGKGPQT